MGRLLVTVLVSCVVGVVRAASGANDWCSEARPCLIGDGDCDKDGDCKDHLRCGKDNCRSNWPSSHDCCYNPYSNGAADYFCTWFTQCWEGQGDCDADNQCGSHLLCGTDNCNRGDWPATHDCCYDPVCPADDGWPATRPGTATRGCGSGFTGELRRVCGERGSWHAASSTCARGECRAADGFPITNTKAQASKSCPAGFSGWYTRDCNANRQWGPIVDNCIQILCRANGPWPGTPAGRTVSRNCADGFSGKVLRSCSITGSWGQEIRNCAQIFCDPEQEWPHTKAGKQATIDCQAGFTGSRERRCDIMGRWQAERDDCTQILCSAEGQWPKTAAGTTADTPCEEGQKGEVTRECGLDGTWQPEQVSCSDVACSSDRGWKATNAGKNSTQQCDRGFSGSRVRWCDLQGVWAAETDTCEQILCNDSTPEWPATKAGSVTSASCAAGFTGIRKRHCTIQGQWESIQDSCVPKSCPWDRTWATATAGTDSIIPCEAGFSGNRVRPCDIDGNWLRESSECQQIYCSATNEWNVTAATDFATAPCQPGFSGAIWRNCLVNGTWGAEMDECQQVSCFAEGPWPSTKANLTAETVCSSGFNGVQRRMCSIEGLWRAVQDECEQIFCEGQGEWPTRKTALAELERDCQPGLTGKESARFLPEGLWEMESSCQQLYCEEDLPWPRSTAGHAAQRPCEAGQTGVGTKNCNLLGHWEPVVWECVRLQCNSTDDWPAINSNNTAIGSCQQGYLGNVTRVCDIHGRWQQPTRYCLQAVSTTLYLSACATKDNANSNQLQQTVAEYFQIDPAQVEVRDFRIDSSSDSSSDCENHITASLSLQVSRGSELLSNINEDDYTITFQAEGMNVQLGSSDGVCASGNDDLAFSLILLGVMLLASFTIWAVRRQKVGYHLFTLALSIFDVFTDMMFLRSILPCLNHSIHSLVICAMVFFVLPLMANMVCSSAVIIREARRNSSYLVWARRYPLAVPVFVVLSCFSSSNLALMDSYLFPSRIFAAPMSKQGKKEVLWMGLITVVFEDIPQMIIQGLVLAEFGNELNTIVLVSLTTSAFCILVGLLKRACRVALDSASATHLNKSTPAPAAEGTEMAPTHTGEEGYAEAEGATKEGTPPPPPPPDHMHATQPALPPPPPPGSV